MARILSTRMVFTFWLMLLSQSLSAFAGITEGIQYLSNQVQQDGSYSSDLKIATPYQSTAEALGTFRALNESQPSEILSAFQFLQNETYQGAEYLSRLIIAQAEHGQIDSNLLSQLQSYQNQDGGFGELAEFQSTPLDTAFALGAIQAANLLNHEIALKAMSYLLIQQNSDGGWSNGRNLSQSYVTALCIQVLAPYANGYQNVSGSITLGQTYLYVQRTANGLWQEDYQTATAILALIATAADQASLQSSVSALAARQGINGSWQQDVYTTALALRALQAFQNRSGGVNSSESGSVIGSVILSGSGEPISFARISSESQPGLSVFSGADGYFRLTGLSAGFQTLVVSKDGYSGTNSVVLIYVGQQSDAGQAALALNTETGMIRGFITDGHDQASIAAVNISLTGPQSYQTISNEAGEFDISSIAPGSYTVRFDKIGYISLTGQLLATAGNVLNIQQSMLKTGAYLDSTPGDITGRFIDGLTGSPLASAHFDLIDGASASSDNEGRFSIDSLPRGSYQAQVGADNYQAQTLSFEFSPGLSGNLGDISLFPVSGISAPNSLTILGVVFDGVSGLPIQDATVEVVEPMQDMVSDELGQFFISDLTVLDIEISISAEGYSSQSYTLSASGFGEIKQSFVLPPANTNTGQTNSTLTGVIKDGLTGSPIPDVTVRLADDSISTSSDSSGQFVLNNVSELAFTVQAFGTGYLEAEQQVTLSSHGSYTLDLTLNAITQNSTDQFQIVTLNAPSGAAGASEVRLFEAIVENLTDQAREALIIGDIVNASGEVVATVTPYLPGTTEVESHFSFDAQENKLLTIPWPTAQNAPGTYQLVLRIVEPGTINRSLPTGVVLAENLVDTSLQSTRSFSGTLDIQPPITQAGTQQPVQLGALIVNSGNVLLDNEILELSIHHPDTNVLLHQVTASVNNMAVSDHLLIFFGEWIPAAEGDLLITIKSRQPTLLGQVEGELYVGDKATGTFTVDKTVVAEGNQTVQAKITLEGVDTARGTLIDPLFFAVQQAVRTGGEYTAREALNWQKRNRCMGCHIQTQSLVGVASAYQKGLGDQFSANTMYNTVASSQQSDGGLRANHPYYTKTQTALGLWSLTAWDDLKVSFRTLYKAAKHMYDRRSQSGNQTWWRPDHYSGWWRSYESHTAMTVKGYVKLINAAEQTDLATISDYSLQSLGSLGSSSANRPLDIEAGPDGLLYSIKRNGEIVQIDPESDTILMIGQSGHNSFGLAIDQDGTQYIVGDNGRLSRRNLDGTVDTLRSGGGTFTDIEFGLDGLLYIVDYTNHRLLRVTDIERGEVQVVAQGGLLKNPYGLAFDSAGNAIIANFSGWNIVKVAMNGSASVFADGLAYRPIWITSDYQGGFYYSSLEYNSAGQSTPSGINYLTADGVVERLSGGNTLRGTVVLEGQAYVVSYNGNHLYEIVSTPINTSLLTNYSNEVTRAANYFLARYRDNNSNNITQAMRLTGLAEARQVITNESLLTQVDTAIAYIEQLLRARQRSDGGWGRYTSYGSDAMVTAVVGLALDYTNPSAADPMIRNTIKYLLSNQLSDHSWKSNNNILGTRLAATSLVVAYLPVALERLGGIDVGLYLTMPNNISLFQPSILPTSQTLGVNNQSQYQWQLLGVTSSSREIVFDLDLLNMQLGEQRLVANEAYIEFKNSFTDELIRVDLSVPAVRAASELKLQLGIDKAVYQAYEQVVIGLSVDNTGPTVAEGYIALTIRALGASKALDLIEPLIVPALSAGQQQALVSKWLTGTTLAGEYEVFSQLFDQHDRLLDQQVTSFKIVHGDSPVIDGRVITDKPMYQAWDQVVIDGRIENTSANVIQSPIRYELKVMDPNGKQVYMQVGDTNELGAGSLQDYSFELTLVDADSGDYTIIWLIQDSFSRELLATRVTSFKVDRKIIQALNGQVVATPTQVYQGDTVLCSEQVNNLAASEIAGVTLTSRLVLVENNQVVWGMQQVVDFVANASVSEARKIDSQGLAIGEYACILQAEIAGQTRQLDIAIFAVLEPPIKIQGQLGAGDRGRVLILLDEAPKLCSGFSGLNLEATLSTPLTDSSTVTATLYDGTGALVDQETGILDERTIDQQTGNGGINLILDDIAATHIVASVNALSLLGESYQLVIVVRDGEMTETFDSGLIYTDCSRTLVVGDNYGQIRLINLIRLPAANDPLGPNHTPDLAVQRSSLETLLTEAGWSYTITTNADDFTRELRSGGYVTYLLLSEQVKLEESVQKELREAVYRGEGLVEAGSHDQRQGRIDIALGVKFQGKHSGMQGLSLTDNSVTQLGDVDFQLTDRSLKATVDGAEILGVFINQDKLTAEPAITQYSYGLGRSVYIGFDLAAEIALSTADSLLETLLLDTLGHVHPATLANLTLGTYPLRITLDNLGIATPGQVIVTLPQNVSVLDSGVAALNQQQLIWPFNFAEAEQLTFDAWLKLPAQSQPVFITALIQSGSAPDWVDQGTLSLELTPEALKTVDSVYMHAADISDKAYKQVQKYLGWALEDSVEERWPAALSALLRASDTLIVIDTAESKTLRIEVAKAIRSVAINMNK